MEFTLEFIKGEGADGSDLLSLGGHLNVQNIGAIKSSLEQELVDCTALQVKVQDVKQFDLSFMQLLIAMKISYKEERRPICFLLNLDEEHERLLNVSGFGDFFYSKY